MSKTILFTGLEGTIINSDCGSSVFGYVVNVSFKDGIFDALYDFAQMNKTSHLFIVTNCVDIEEGTKSEDLFQSQLYYVSCCLNALLDSRIDNVHVHTVSRHCNSTGADTDRCKPNTGMLDNLLHVCFPYRIPPKQDMLMIGSISGSDDDEHDEQTAKNFGIDYMDVSEFIRKYKH
jgi:hypothetical protein